nr:MAG TPA: minor tail protein [Caudoviricetes sp.]
MKAILDDKVTPEVEKLAAACGMSVQKFKEMMAQVYRVQQQFSNYSPEVIRALKTVQRENERIAKEAERTAKQLEKEKLKAIKETEKEEIRKAKEIQKINQQLAKEAARLAKESQKEEVRRLKEIEKSNQQAIKNAEKLAKTIEKEKQKEIKIAEKTAKQIEQEEIKKAKATIREAEKIEKANKKAFEQSAKEAAKAAKETEKAYNNAVKKMKTNFNEIYNSAKVAFVGIAGLAGYSVKGFADFEFSMKKIRTISNDSVDTISTNIRKMAYDTGISSEELAGSLYDLVQTIQDVPEKYEMLDTVSKLSVAGFSNSADAVNLLTSTILSYKYQIKDAELLSSKFLVAQTRGNTTITQLANSLGTVMPIAKMANVEFDQLLASISTMTLGGVKTDEATTFLRAMLNELTKADSDVSELFQKINKGMDFKTYMANGGNLIDAIEMLRIEAEKGNQSLLDLFGNVRSSLGAGTLTGLKDEYISILSEIANAPVEHLDNTFKRINDGTKTNLDKIKETISQFRMEIGNRVAEDIGEALNITNDKSFKEMFNKERIDDIYATGKAILYVAGTITALGLAIKTATILNTTFASIKTFVTWVTTTGNVALIEFTTTIGALIYGINDLNNMDFKNIQDLENLKKENNELENQKELINAVKEDLEKGIINPDFLLVVDGMDNLKESLKEISMLDPNTDEFNKKLNDLLEKVRELQNELNNTNGKVVNVDIGVNIRMPKIKAEDLTRYDDDIQNFTNEVLKYNNEKKSENKTVVIGSSGTGKNKKSKSGGSNKDPFKDFISELGAKIKFDLNLDDKIQKLEESKTKFKKNINEINIAIDNFKIEDLGNKITKVLDGISLKSHNYSIDEQIEKINQARVYLEEQLNLAQKNGLKDLANEVKEKLTKLDLTKTLLPIEKQTEDISKELEKIKETSSELEKKKESLSFDEIKNQKEALQRDIESQKSVIETVKNAYSDLLDKGIITQGDYDKYIEELDKLGKSAKEAGDSLKELPKNLNTAFSGLAQNMQSLGSAVGSKTIGSIGNIIGGINNLKDISNTFKSGGGLKSILGMFGTGGSLAGGITSIGTLIGGATAGLGIVKSIGSIIGFGKGKNKAAEIDNRNRENENRYQEQIKAMQTLTEALKKNADYVKNFTDRILTEAAKNPTLSFLGNSNRNIDLFQQAMLNGKHFSDISALEKGSTRYSRGFGRKKKSKDTYTAVSVGEAQLLKYLGFDKTELDNFTDSEIRQLNNVLKNVSHNDLVKATGRNLTQSNLDEWKKQISEFVSQLDLLQKEKKDLFRGSTLDSFTGIDYSSEKKLIQEYTEQFKQMGLVGEQYNETIKEMARNNQVLVTAMQDVRAQTIEGLASGNGGFVTSMKSYFEKIFKNASSVAYDVAFSDLDRYFNDEFKKISEKLVNIKKTGKLNFNNLLAGVDFSKLKLAESIETQAKKSLDTIKQFLLSRGIDISIINKILPNSDFNDKLNDMKNALSNAMNEAQKEKKFDSFTKSLGESLYESTKASLIKAFSESSVYQGLISKFVNTEDMKAEIEKAGTFEGAFNIIKNKLKDFGYRLESNGLGGFDAINNKDKTDNQLGNAYYQDKSSNVEIKVTNNFYEKVYGVDDLEGRILKSVNIGIEAWTKKPKVAP